MPATNGDRHIWERLRGGMGAPNGLPPRGTVPLYAGKPPALELFTEWRIRKWDLGIAVDRSALLADPTSPAAGTGTEWISTAQGGGGTITLVATGWPPYMRISTGTTSRDGFSFQANALGAFWDLQSGSKLREAFLSLTFRLNDITNTALFFGFAPTDTTILSSGATLNNWVGIRKVASATTLELAASNTAVAVSAPTGTTIGDLATDDKTGATAEGDWVTMALEVVDNLVNAHFLNHRQVGGRLYATHRASIILPALGAVSTPTFTLVTTETAANTFDVTQITASGRYALGGDSRA